MPRGSWPLTLLLALAPAAGAAGPPRAPVAVDFNRDVRPILSNRCFACHGPDRKKGGLRLDERASALKRGALVPGSASRSELFERVSAESPRRMPPARGGNALTPAQVETLRRWIDQGARYSPHWAYVPPKRPVPPAVKDRDWARNAIDSFVLARLEKESLKPSPPADRATLIRRVTLDLTGLPPTPQEIDAFLSDNSPDAYEKVVDRLLASPRYGEHVARAWLDLARYADSNGFRLDNHRDMWPWRDWVISAFNANMPFDQFTVEQLAGDLLPNPTLSQRVATGFHRNTMVNFGNGSDPREYLAKAVSDRVATTATVWLGTTLACASCHDHKYDPFTQKDFYSFYAFFHNVAEKGLDGEKTNPVPVLKVPSSEQARRLADLRRQLARLDVCAPERVRLKREEADLLARVPETLVMQELPTPRVTHVFVRGDYQNEGEVVTPAAPASLPPLPRGAPPNRLGLARWLVDPGNPLTARVTVNRAWQAFFGAGIVRTADDFGAQGELPTHPELLDWLAVEFREGGWDVKKLHHLIVTSATYRQSSNVTRELLEKDPQNRLLARAPRLRLDAEGVRDNALAAGGLLDSRIGGPSVRPYQPPGLWEQVAVGGDYSGQTYEQSRGPDLYRRGVYTYWKRSLPHPALVAFDAPTRELCTVTRPRTNTPLQALVLLNDPQFVEAARALAQRTLRDGGADDPARLRYAFRLCTGRKPNAAELRVLTRVLDEQLRHYRAHPGAARDLVAVGESPRPAGLDVGVLAAWTAVGNLLLNLDETITRG